MNLVALGICIIGALALIAYVRWENKQREMGRRDHVLEEAERDGTVDELYHKHPR